MINAAISTLTESVCAVLSGEIPSLYLYGSAAAGDYRNGWSDIDILCLTRRSLTMEQAQALLELRQELSSNHNNGIYRLFEGAFLSVRALQEQTPDIVVYWGTSGQRITDRYDFNSFSMVELKTIGRLLCGPDVRPVLVTPGYDALRRDVQRHYEIVRKYAVTTDGSLYACGWLLDIARCLYTLRTGQVIAKTAAGEWALKETLCNVPEAMEKALAVRKNPLAHKGTPQYKAWAVRLGPVVQKFADVLERELKLHA